MIIIFNNLNQNYGFNRSRFGFKPESTPNLAGKMRDKKKKRKCRRENDKCDE